MNKILKEGLILLLLLKVACAVLPEYLRRVLTYYSAYTADIDDYTIFENCLVPTAQP